VLVGPQAWDGDDDAVVEEEKEAVVVGVERCRGT
jgi:hypothetical protein